MAQLICSNIIAAKAREINERIAVNSSVEFLVVPSENRGVKVTTAKKPKTEAELLDYATNNLLRALKRDMQRKRGRVNYDKLRREGYSERFLAKLKNA